MRTDTIELFNSHQGIIQQVAWAFAQQFNVNQEELYCVGRTEALKVANKWHPGRGKFSTFLTWCLRKHFCDTVKKMTVEIATPEDEMPQDAVPAVPCGGEFVGKVTQAVDSWDAVEVLEAVESMMDDALLNERQMAPCQMRALVADRLKSQLGWRRPRIQHAFAELSNVIKSL